MSLAMTLPTATLETILPRVAAIFLEGAGGDQTAARLAAIEMLAGYHPDTAEELRVAAKIVIFSFQALEALAQAALPNMPLPLVLLLRSGSVSLSRESEKAERRLDRLRKARRAGRSAESAAIPPEPERPDPKIEQIVDLIDDTRKVAAVAKATGLTWAQAYEQRQAEKRLAAKARKAEARLPTHANQAAASKRHSDSAAAT